ncbi:MAG: S9 family peptidase [Phycisphaerales bacterium]|nr:S9 family peptidase [Phycisphaerales bacterium]
MASSTRRKPVTPEDLKELVFVSDPQVSPDGSRVLFTRKTIGDKNAYETSLWTVSTRRGAARPFTHGPRDGRGRWSPDGSRIAFSSARDKNIPQIHLIDADGGEARPLTDLPQGSLGDFSWSPNGRQIAFTFREREQEWTKAACKDREENGGTPPPRVLHNTWYRLDGDGYFNDERYKLYILDVETGSTRLLYDKDTFGEISYCWSPDSRTLALTTTRNRDVIRAYRDYQLLKIDVESGSITPLKDVPKGPKTQVTWSPDGRHLAWAGRTGSDGAYSTENLELWTCTASGRKSRSLSEGTDWCLMACALSDSADVSFAPNIQWSPDSKRLLVSIGWHGQSHVVSFTLSGSSIRTLTDGRAVVTPGNTSADGRTMAMVVDTPSTPPEIHVGRVGATKITPRRLTDFNDAYLASRHIRKPSVKWVPSTDGTKVQTWVMTPPNFKKGRTYPAILEIHGGPHAQYGECFFHEFQVLASAGYIVIYSNPRGSKGYGRDHTAAIRGSWGGKDWEDIRSVKEFMQNHPSINARRMGVMGGSYGGYMTLWVIGHTTDFAGAITDRCVSNLVSMGGNSDFVDIPDSYWKGSFWECPDELWHSSPIRTMGRVKTPTMIIHSEGDLRCNVEQADQVFAALQIRKVPSVFVRYPRETSHGMSRNGPPDMRLHRLHQILGWWKQYLGSGRRKARR